MSPRVGWLSLITCLVVGCTSESPPDPRIEEGRLLYERYCALCHGKKGEGYVADNATALGNQEFLATASDELIRRGIARGRPGTTMSAWGKAAGGPLSDADVDRLVAFLRAFQSKPSVDVRAPVTGGEPLRGQAVYSTFCLECHGVEGKGQKYISIANPELLAVASDGFVRHAIEFGRPGTPMPGFGATLTDQNLRDLTALVRSWAKPATEPPTELPSKDLGNPVVNPTGPDAVFDAGPYAPAAKVKAELDRGARLVFLDARAPGDYSREHITGAVSVPFYSVTDYFSQLPRDATIISYCACPHAESGAAADALVKAGWTKVKVLDEGFFHWKTQGYPTKVGAKP